MLRFFKLIKKSKVNKTGSNLNRRNPITIQRRNNLEPNHSDINQREIIRTGAQFNRTNQQKNISDPLMAHALTERQQPREEPTIGNAILQLAREKLLSEQHGHWQNEAPDNLNKEARMIHSLSLFAPKRKELYSPCYVTNMKNIYNIYKELYETLESKRSRPCMASLAQNEQTSGGYKQDEHIELSLKEVRELLNIPNNKQITLLNLVVNAQKNTNSSILLHMIQNLMVHTLCEQDEGKEKLIQFIETVREILPQRLWHELETQNVPVDVIIKLMKNTLNDDLLQEWRENTKNIKRPLAHTQWCALPNGLRDGTIESYYELLQIKAHPEFGRKASMILLEIPKEFESTITGAFSKAMANSDKGIGGNEQIYFSEIDILFLLHVSSHRVIYQDDNQKHYSNQKISDREKNGDNIITIGEVSNNDSIVLATTQDESDNSTNSFGCK